VADHCLEYALEHPDLLGVWGGTTDAQPKALRRGRAAELVHLLTQPRCAEFVTPQVDGHRPWHVVGERHGVGVDLALVEGLQAGIALQARGS
jgi:hypothetical protein